MREAIDELWSSGGQSPDSGADPAHAQKRHPAHVPRGPRARAGRAAAHRRGAGEDDLHPRLHGRAHLRGGPHQEVLHALRAARRPADAGLRLQHVLPRTRTRAYPGAVGTPRSGASDATGSRATRGRCSSRQARPGHGRRRAASAGRWSRFAGEGARVAFTYTRDEDGAQRRSRRAAPRRGPSRPRCSTRRPRRRWSAELEQAWGGIDILVNNAGVTQNLPLALMEEEDWDRVMDINVKGAFLTRATVLRGMVRRKAASSSTSARSPACG